MIILRNIQRNLKKEQIQKAYKGIMTFMSRFKTHMESRYPEYLASSLYFGYMDMTYFAFTPIKLKRRKLKVAIVYIHKQNRFEVWLGGTNRSVQTQYIEIMRKKNIGDYKLSQVLQGVDSIIEMKIAEQPDFNHMEELILIIERKIIEFTNNVLSMLSE